MRKLGLAVLCLVSTTATGRQPSPPTSHPNALPTVSIDDMAWQMLVAALEESKTASPAVRAKVMLEFAKQLDQDNKKSDELTVLREAYLATLQVQAMKYDTVSTVQGDIQRAIMKNLGPEPLEALLPHMNEGQRGLAFDLLVTRYTADKNWDRAMDAVRRAPRDNWFPFAPVFELMKALPSGQVGARREIFATEYAIYRDGWISAGGLAQVVERFWRELPREQVVELIPIILKGFMRGQIYFIKRPIYFYDQEKPKYLAILRELDATKAEQWERDEQKTWDEVRKQGPGWVTSEQMRRRQAAMGSLPQEPANPMPNTKPPGSPKPRVVAGCLEDEPWCQQNRVEHALESVKEHLLKRETELAKQGIARGYWIALSQWKLDTDPVDPNQVPKTEWPSTLNWQIFSILATRISAEYALDQIKKIPDPEIRLLTKTAVARVWLNHTPSFPCPSLRSNYHNEGTCIGYRAYLPNELFRWENYWE